LEGDSNGVSFHPPSSALDVEFPSKPVWNNTDEDNWMDQHSHHKIIQAPFYDDDGDDGYVKMMNGYCRWTSRVRLLPPLNDPLVTKLPSSTARRHAQQ
jgi:hypothetical protein